MKQNPTTAIKAKFSNQIHKLLEQNIDLKRRERWMKKKPLTDKEKLELFEKIQALHEETSAELRNYIYDKKRKKKIQKARIDRGVVPKKRTTKEEYLKSVKAA